MSRIGKKEITIPNGVAVTLKDGSISIKGPKGMLKRELPPNVEVEVDKEQIRVLRA